MLSPDLPKALDEIGVENKRATLRQRYYEGVHLLVSQGKKQAAIDLISLAVGITAFDESLTTPPSKRRFHKPVIINQPKNIQLRTASSQLDDFTYQGRSPLCYELLTQNDYPELRDATNVVFDGEETYPKNLRLRKLGSRICGSCTYRESCDANITIAIKP